VVEIRVEPYDGPVAQELIAAVQQEYVERYGGPDDSPVDPLDFTPPRGCFVVAYAGAEAVATGALRPAEDGSVGEGAIGDGAMEIKRMYVRPDWRGRGLARVVLADLEQRARDFGAKRIVLETGERQPEAIRLYETSGYARIDGYGHYACSPMSVSFGKDL
jgi:GNAT superfamily N-acetyltransferase